MYLPERAVSEIIQGHGKTLDDVRRERGILEHLDNVGVFLANLVDFLVFLIQDVVEIVAGEKVLQGVGDNVPGSGHLDVVQEFRAIRRLLDDLRSEEQARTLAPQSAVAALGENHALEKIVNGVEVDVILGYVDELELITE